MVDDLGLATDLLITFPMRSLHVIAGALVLLSCIGQMKAEPANKCLSLEPTVVQLTGTLISKTYPGPPNYKNIKHGDELETYWFLDLKLRACIDFGDTSNFRGIRRKEIARVQLTFRNADAERTAEYLAGQRITLTGSLIRASTRDHRIPVLLWVTDVKAECREYLSYEPAVVKLTGVIISKTYPGPPNYESIKDGDEPETYWLLALSHPICVNEKPSAFYEAAKNVRRVQLVFSSEKTYTTYRRLLGKRAMATGTLYGAHTGHHKTPVLLTVSTLSKTR